MFFCTHFTSNCNYYIQLRHGGSLTSHHDFHNFQFSNILLYYFGILRKEFQFQTFYILSKFQAAKDFIFVFVIIDHFYIFLYFLHFYFFIFFLYFYCLLQSTEASFLFTTSDIILFFWKLSVPTFYILSLPLKYASSNEKLLQ